MKTVRIGEQIWMTENLNVDKFRNGDPIPEARTDEEWVEAGKNKKPAWCYYENDPANGEKYGKLYNWYAVNDPRGLAPEGWSIPTHEEWGQLLTYLGGITVAGKKLKNKEDWDESVNSTNETCYTALAGGFRHSSGQFFGILELAFWWCGSDLDDTFARSRYLERGTFFVGSDARFKSDGLSVRCIR